MKNWRTYSVIHRDKQRGREDVKRNDNYPLIHSAYGTHKHTHTDPHTKTHSSADFDFVHTYTHTYTHTRTHMTTDPIPLS